MSQEPSMYVVLPKDHNGVVDNVTHCSSLYCMISNS